MSDKEVGESAQTGEFTELKSSPAGKRLHERKKTVAEGLLDIGLLVANASELKTLLDQGDSYAYYHVLLVLLILTFLIQITVGFLILVLGNLEEDPANEKRTNRLNNALMALVFISIVLNVVVSVFGISTEAD